MIQMVYLPIDLRTYLLWKFWLDCDIMEQVMSALIQSGVLLALYTMVPLYDIMSDF
jgi:hypothetical protein